MVRTAKVKAALSWLRANNPRYRDVTLNEHWDEHTEDDTLQDIIDRQDENTTHEADSDDTANEMQIPTTSDTQGMSVDDEDTHAETQPMTATNDTLDDEANRDDATEPDNENDADFDERDQLHGVANDTCLQPIEFTSQALSQLHDAIFSIAPAEGNRPVSLMSNDDDQDTEATTFPGLFPTGKGTFKSERLTKLTLSKYLNARLLGSDLRFAQNTQYIFFAQYAKELEQLLSGIRIAMRKGATKTRAGQQITATMLKDKDEMSNILKSDLGFHHFEALRGSPTYWNKCMNELFAMIRQLGCPFILCHILGCRTVTLARSHCSNPKAERNRCRL